MESILIPIGKHALRVDLFDPERNLLIEAKAEPTRANIRYAIGQLYDYQRRINPRPDLALLVPMRPIDDLCDLLRAAGVSVIWEENGDFVEDHFTRAAQR